MRVYEEVKKIIPPTVMKGITRSRFKFLPVFNSWDEALKKSTESVYQQNKLTKLIHEKTDSYRKNLSSEIFSLNNSEIQTITALGIVNSSQKCSGKITVIDFGGACGAHFFAAKKFFNNVEFDWRVVETAEMAEEASCFESKELHFYSDLESAINQTNTIHLIHSSGTLQCISEPYISLERLVNLRAEFMLLSRLGVTPEDKEIITIYKHMMSGHGPGSAPSDFKDEICTYPFQYPSKKKIETILSKNHNIEFINDDPSGKFSVGSHEIIGVTYFCKKKTS